MIQSLTTDIMKGDSTQEAFRKQASKLTEVVTDYGHPFLDDYPELLVLHKRDCVDDSVVAIIRNYETLGKDQCKKFKEEVLEEREEVFVIQLREIRSLFLEHQNKRKILQRQNSLPNSKMMFRYLGDCKLQTN